MPDEHVPEVPEKGQTVLVADDQLWARDPIAEMLTQAGYRILTARDGRSTVAEFEEHADEIVAVLLDYNMPGGTGEEVFEQLQRIRPNIPVIMMSSFVEHEVIGHFLGMGVVGFLQKPFGRYTLLAAVRKALGPPAA